MKKSIYLFIYFFSVITFHRFYVIGLIEALKYAFSIRVQIITYMNLFSYTHIYVYMLSLK